MSHATTAYAGDSQSSYKSYLVGFIFSIVLTIIPFTMVMNGCWSKSTLIAVLTISAVLQILVHLVYFLHLNISSEQQWNLIAFFFTTLIIAILVVGSLWIMWHLHYNLMSY